MPFEVVKKQRTMKDLSFVLSYVGFLLISLGTILLLIPALPWVYYRVNVQATTDEVEALSGFIGVGSVLPTPSVSKPPKEVFKLPAYDGSLPEDNTLIIPRIGVNTVLQEGSDSKKALYHGVWRVPEFGTPLNNDNAIILAAHRFGYIEWSSEFRKKSTFANLPSLKSGDTLQIIWNQRAFVYRVYKVEEGTSIKDYDADVILYTCKYLKSPVRIMVYAKRVS